MMPRRGYAFAGMMPRRVPPQSGRLYERLRGAARFAHAAIKTYHTMYPHRATGALLDAAGRLWEVLDDE